jgi:hypothetical protein
MRKFVFLAVISCLLSACAATYHAAESGSSGYRDIRVDRGIYYVEYTESSNRSWKVIHGFALKRCAEITKENGYKFFDVLSKDEIEVFLDNNVDQISVTNPEGTGPASNTYSLKGSKVEGRRVVYKIKLSNQ